MKIAIYNNIEGLYRKNSNCIERLGCKLYKLYYVKIC